MNLRIKSEFVATPRLKTHLLTGGTDQGATVVFVHGNASSGRFFLDTMEAFASKFRVIAPDLRGYGESETNKVDATRGLRDFSDDLHSLLSVIEPRPRGQKVHLVGWSVGGGVVLQFAIDHPTEVASIVLVNPVSPYGFGGTKDNRGTPCWPDFAGSGGGTANPEFVKRLSEQDRTDESPFSPRNVMNTYYFKPPFRAADEDAFVNSVLSTKTHPDNYPGDLTTSDNWPGIAPGTAGMNNAISPKFLNLSRFVSVTPRPEVLWIRGDSDQIVSDTSLFDLGFLGKLGAVPGWPGDAVYPAQPMVSQTRSLLEAYKAVGGWYREEVISDCGHSPLIEKPDEFRKLLLNFLPGR